jgi:ribosomal protein L16 Arg81 hydroxylase
MAVSIDRTEGLSVEDFHARYSEPERPVVLRGAIREWTLFKTWTPAYLKSLLGAHPVNVARSPDGGEYFDPDTGVDHRRTLVLPFDEFVDRAFNGGTKEKLYLLQASTKEFAPLTQEIVVPEYARPPILFNNVWIGSEGNVTRCHYDMQDNLLAQVVGRKRVTLFPSRHMRQLYPRSPFGNKPNFSRVDVIQPDYGRFPRFRDVTAYETQLDPGDMLYIPIHWFHHVVSLDAAISLNYWWRARLRQSLRPAALWYWPQMVANGHLKHEIAGLARKVATTLLARGRRP